ncbi:MAG: hypothetical protein WC595_05565 [Candidatus Nanoarchaeia archaeon]
MKPKKKSRLLLICIFILLLIAVSTGYYFVNTDEPGTVVKDNRIKNEIPDDPIPCCMPDENGSITCCEDNERILPELHIALFYSTVLSDIDKRLAVSVQDTSSSEGYTTNINWEKTDKGVVRYIPQLDRFDVMGTTTSYSHSKGSISPFTIGNRLFLVRLRESASTLTEVDPATAKPIATVPISNKEFAVVGNNVYYREEVREDLFNKRTGGGELIVHTLKEPSPKTLLAYGDPSNKGRFYGTKDSLLSVVYDPSTKKNSIILHNKNTGRAVNTLYTGVENMGEFIPSDDALYQLIKKDNKYELNEFPVLGEESTLLEFELEPGERDISVDIMYGTALLVSYDQDFKVKQILKIELATGDITKLPVESPFGSVSSQNYQALYMESF